MLIAGVDVATIVSAISHAVVGAPPLTLTATGKCWPGTPDWPWGAKRTSPKRHSPVCRPVLVAVIVSVIEDGRLVSIKPVEGRWSASRVNEAGDTDSVKPGSETVVTT